MISPTKLWCLKTKFLLLQIDPIPKLVRYARIPAKIGNVKTSLKIKISIIEESLRAAVTILLSKSKSYFGISNRKKKSPKIDQNDPLWNWAKK